ncbi:hypothetical protein HJG45_06240 [Roseicella sp. DB1501]|nr:hypothetical protein [Roseicella sp. DB1501]
MPWFDAAFSRCAQKFFFILAKDDKPRHGNLGSRLTAASFARHGGC